MGVLSLSGVPIVYYPDQDQGCGILFSWGLGYTQFGRKVDGMRREIRILRSFDGALNTFNTEHSLFYTETLQLVMHGYTTAAPIIFFRKSSTMDFSPREILFFKLLQIITNRLSVSYFRTVILAQAPISINIVS